MNIGLKIGVSLQGPLAHLVRLLMRLNLFRFQIDAALVVDGQELQPDVVFDRDSVQVSTGRFSRN